MTHPTIVVGFALAGADGSFISGGPEPSDPWNEYLLAIEGQMITLSVEEAQVLRDALDEWLAVGETETIGTPESELATAFEEFSQHLSAAFDDAVAVKSPAPFVEPPAPQFENPFAEVNGVRFFAGLGVPDEVMEAAMAQWQALGFLGEDGSTFDQEKAEALPFGRGYIDQRRTSQQQERDNEYGPDEHDCPWCANHTDPASLNARGIDYSGLLGNVEARADKHVARAEQMVRAEGFSEPVFLDDEPVGRGVQIGDTVVNDPDARRRPSPAYIDSVRRLQGLPPIRREPVNTDPEDALW